MPSKKSKKRELVPAEPQPAVIVQILNCTTEIAWIVLEFMFGSMLVRKGLNDTRAMIWDDDSVPIAVMLFVHIFSTVAIIYWVLYRFSTSVGLVVPVLIRRLGLTRPRIGKVVFIVALLHVMGSALMAFSQKMADRWFFTWDNYYPEEYFDYVNAVEILFLAPVREEILFRGVVYSVVYRRFGGARSGAKIRCVWASSVAFGLVHFFNFMGTKYTSSYVVMQIFLGTLIGAFYCQRFMMTCNIVETIALHMVNNLCSSFLPLDIEFDFTDPLLALPLLQTVVVYTLLVWIMHKRASSLPPSSFPVFKPMSSSYDDDDDDGDHDSDDDGKSQSEKSDNDRNVKKKKKALQDVKNRDKTD